LGVIKIEYIYAGLLLHNAKQPIDEAHLKKVLAASGVEVNEARSKALVAALSEINIDEAIKSAAVPMAAAPVAAAAPAAEAKKEGKKEEKKEVASEEETAEGLGSLFG
jgi:large subunit ribosomal protein L12